MAIVYRQKMTILRTVKRYDERGFVKLAKRSTRQPKLIEGRRRMFKKEVNALIAKNYDYFTTSICRI